MPCPACLALNGSNGVKHDTDTGIITAMNYCGRFAPSPTGDLHAGSLATALASWLCARKTGGRWLLRVDDIDPPREVPGSAAGILATLERFGLRADAPVLYQSTRHAAYGQALDHLKASGHAFACWCSRQDLAASGGLHRSGHCVAPADATRPPAWRLRVDAAVISFDDALQGPQRQALQPSVGDFVLRRADGCWGYHLACVVDDAFQGITEVVRGADLLDSTPRQILLQRLLQLPTPHYLHIPLVRRADGDKLSKLTHARAIGQGDPLPALRDALSFLGLPVDLPGTHVNGLLQQALAAFDPQQMAHQQTPG